MTVNKRLEKLEQKANPKNKITTWEQFVKCEDETIEGWAEFLSDLLGGDLSKLEDKTPEYQRSMLTLAGAIEKEVSNERNPETVGTT